MSRCLSIYKKDRNFQSSEHQEIGQNNAKLQFPARKPQVDVEEKRIPVPEQVQQIQDNGQKHGLQYEGIHEEGIRKLPGKKPKTEKIIHSADEQLRLSVVPG
jgi:hypothetical protein